MTPIVTVDDAYDRDYAGDGISRFGAYVRQRAHLFVDDWEPLSPVTFAVTVWTIATGPIMSPSYVRIRRSIQAVNCRHGDEPGLLLAEIAVRLPWPGGLRDKPSLQGWVSGHRHSGGSDALDEQRPALLVDGRLRVPIPEDRLPSPSRFAALDVGVAKQAITAICEQVNTVAGPVLADLRSETTTGVLR